MNAELFGNLIKIFWDFMCQKFDFWGYSVSLASVLIAGCLLGVCGWAIFKIAS